MGSTASNEILARQEIKAKLLDLGTTAVPTRLAAFTTLVKDQVGLLAPTVKGAAIKR